ncbi:MAG: TonB family protein [Bacteroidota bacterium]
MTQYVNWLYESSVLIFGISLIYQFFLKNRINFGFHRVFLLSGLIIALVFPIISFPSSGPANESGDFAALLSTVTVVPGETKSFFLTPALQWKSLHLVYIIGVTILFIRMVHGLIKLGLLSRKAEFTSFGSYRVAFLPGHFSPFSFFNLIFISKNVHTTEETTQIIAHEVFHARLWHSLDVILLELLLIFQWFNPFAWLMRRWLKQLHEFQADRKVLQSGTPLVNYKKLLLYQCTGARVELANSFHRSFIKKRFIMMTKNNTHTRRNSIFAIMVCVLFIGGFMACNQTEDEQNLGVKKAPSTEENQPPEDEEPSGEVFFVVEDMPEFPGGENALRNYLGNETNYPEEAIENNLEGRAYVKFVITKEGEISQTKIAKSSGHDMLDKEALRVVEGMPDWKPGRQRGEKVNVSFTVPINFELSGDEK